MINVGNFIDFVIIPNLGYYSGIRAGFPASLSGESIEGFYFMHICNFKSRFGDSLAIFTVRA